MFAYFLLFFVSDTSHITVHIVFLPSIDLCMVRVVIRSTVNRAYTSRISVTLPVTRLQPVGNGEEEESRGIGGNPTMP